MMTIQTIVVIYCIILVVMVIYQLIILVMPLFTITKSLNYNYYNKDEFYEKLRAKPPNQQNFIRSRMIYINKNLIDIRTPKYLHNLMFNMDIKELGELVYDSQQKCKQDIKRILQNDEYGVNIHIYL
eukprot:70674_1